MNTPIAFTCINKLTRSLATDPPSATYTIDNYFQVLFLLIHQFMNGFPPLTTRNLAAKLLMCHTCVTIVVTRLIELKIVEVKNEAKIGIIGCESKETDLQPASGTGSNKNND